jgi:hypothetical protein
MNHQSERHRLTYYAFGSTMSSLSWLCPKCADKREAARSAKYEQAKAEESRKPQATETASPKIDLSQILKELKGTD